MIKGIFKCSGNENQSIDQELLDNLGYSYKEANLDSQKMLELARAQKNQLKKDYLMLPFCHTVEAENLGSEIIYDNLLGNRIKSYKVKTLDDLKDLEKLDFQAGRLAQVLKAVKLGKEEGEILVVNVTGPITLITSIMDTGLFYKILRKNRKELELALDLIEKSLVDYILRLVELEVDYISYADPTGTIDLVGPKVYKNLSGQSSYRILKSLEGRLGKTTIHICGKSSSSLINIGLMTVENHKPQGGSYMEKMESLKKDINPDFLGNWCLKRDENPKIVRQCRLV